MDLLMTELLQYASSEEEVVQSLQEEQNCLVNDLTDSQLEILRCEESSTCLAETDCALFAEDSNPCAAPVARKVFFAKGEAPVDDSFDALNCCGLSKVEFIATVASVGAFVLVLTVVLCCLYRKGKLQKCCSKCRGLPCCGCLRRASYSQGDSTDEFYQESESEPEAREKLELLEGTGLEDPEGRYELALRDGKQMYDDDDLEP